MNIQVLLNRTSEWVRGKGPEADIVLTSRVRLARNLGSLPFPHQAATRQRQEILGDVEKVLGGVPEMVGSLFVSLNDVDEMDKQFLVERHLISREQAQQGEPSGVAISDMEIFAVMINEEDHLRMQTLRSGFQLRAAYEMVDKLDDQLEQKLDYAFHPTLGFLTACPTNAGTGMRASVMLHLPALVMTKQINQVLQAIIKLGLAVRGLYGEGTEAAGNLFQISNQITLGKSESDILSNLERVIKQIVGHEKAARGTLAKRNPFVLQDKIGRAFGVMKNAHVMTSKEAIELLSTLRLGVDLEMFKGLDRQTINELILLIQPAHLQKVANKPLEGAERDVVRAQLIRQRLQRATRPGEQEN